MDKSAKIYIAGHRGLAGSALVRSLRNQGYTNLLVRTHAELDLTNQGAAEAFFSQEKPDYVFLAAGKVGGILANNTYPAEFIRDNLAMEINIIHAAWKHNVRRLVFLGSSCIYPRDCPQPIKEEYLLTGPLEPTNRPYALAKIAGIEMCWSYNRQYGTKFLAVMPTNLYGPGDNYDLQNCHVMPAFIRRCHEAKSGASLTSKTHASEENKFVIWGTGAPHREFLYSDDMADACVFLMNLPDDTFSSLLPPNFAPLINIGYGEDMTIRDLAEVVKEAVGYSGDIVWDKSKPDGTPRKLLDSSRLRALGWKPTIAIDEGIPKAYRDYLDNNVVR